MTRTLLLIAAFLVLTLGSFIWFVATWDADREPSLGFFWPQIPPPEASVGQGPAEFPPAESTFA